MEIIYTPTHLRNVAWIRVWFLSNARIEKNDEGKQAREGFGLGESINVDLSMDAFRRCCWCIRRRKTRQLFFDRIHRADNEEEETH